MLEQLQTHLSTIIKNIKGQGKISESNVSDVLRDIRIALLEADVNLKVAKKFVEHVKEKALGEKVLNSISPGQQFTKILFDELKFFLGDEAKPLEFDSSGLTVILLAGLQGCGKTTTCGKLARFLKKDKGKDSLLIAADLQRPAAIDQLITIGKSIDIDVYSEKNNDPIAVVKNGLIEAKRQGKDIAVIDTAGRLHIDEDMMNQLKSIIEVSNPNEILFVADGMTGQDAVNSSRSFNEAIDITGIILTKMDGDSKGGAALSIKDIIQRPIKFIGTGESIDKLENFHPERYASRILGMGDVVSLVEKAQSVVDKESLENLEQKIKNQTFSLMDFQDQIKQIKKMGPLSEVMGMIPGANKLKMGDFSDKNLKWVEAIISSMTFKERINPGIINGSRRKRIADGSGRPVQEVNALLKQYKQMKSMMKTMNKNKGKLKFPFM
ncbi:MAG: signal recognition particle protein [bacterium TMED161]|nr:MAG: signal recognition particle protein [bacterium TMED161]|tara:strand:+ start:21312 stop:22625 length:1314 start_codon:yes stop_codon:yes gene_type:complete